MKIKEGYLLRKVAGDFVVVPVGNLDFDGMIQLNETGAFLWQHLLEDTDEESLTKALLSEYEIEETKASRDVSVFINTLKEHDLIYG